MGDTVRRSLVAVLTCCLLGVVPAAHAAPAVPAPAQVLFSEDFENAPAPDAGPATLITAYQGAAPQAMTYEAAPEWNGSQPRDCNGLIVRGSMANNVFAACDTPLLAGDLMRASARALALVEDPSLAQDGPAALANDAVTAATAAPFPPSDYSNKIQLQTVAPLTVPAGRFVNFSVDVAEVGCQGPNWARLRFARTDSAGANPVDLTSTPIVPCPSTIKPDGQGSLITTTTSPNYAVYGGRFPSSGSLLSDGQPFRVRMTNDPGGPFNGGNGNDSAIDNLRVIDATPIADKRFGSPATPGALRAGLQIFVTNTDDLAGKNGFSFTDTLPSGLSAAPGAQPSVTCFAGATPTATTFPVSLAGTQLTVAPGAGTLAAGDTHCRIDIDVVAGGPGTFTADAGQIANRIGVDAGTGDSVTVSPASSLPAAPLTPAPVSRPQCSDGRDNDGDGAVDRLDPGCASASDVNEGDESVGDLVLCGRSKIRLVRADATGRRVSLSGVVSPALAGRRVTLSSTLGRKSTRLTTIKPKRDGTFSATVSAPPRRDRIKIRYRAAVAGARSVALKLPQTLSTSSVRRAGAQIVVRGTVQRNRLGKANPVQIRRILCGRSRVVGSAKPARNGSYTVRFKAPPSGDFAFYRAEASVLARPGSKRYVKQYARGVTIKLSGASG